MTRLLYVSTNAGFQIWTYRDGCLRVWWVDELAANGDPAGADIYKRDEDGEICGYGKNSYDEEKAIKILEAIEDDTGLEPIETDLDEELNDETIYVIADIERDDL